MWIFKSNFNTLDSNDTPAAVFVTPLESNFHNDHENRSAKSEPPSRKKHNFLTAKAETADF